MEKQISENKQTRSWERKRTCTAIVFTLQYFIFGAQTSGNAATLWIYVTTIMKTDYPALLYGLIEASIFIPPILFSTVIGRRFDKTRRFRLCPIIANFMSIIGSILYVTSSHYLALTGKFLQGCAIASRPLMVAEIVRSYHNNELQHKLPILSCAEAFGGAAGPVIMVMFLHTDFRIFDIHVTYANVSGLVFLSLGIVTQVLVVFMVSDLSREFDLKQHDENNIGNEDNTEENVKSLKSVLKKIVTNIDPLCNDLYIFYENLRCCNIPNASNNYFAKFSLQRYNG